MISVRSERDRLIVAGAGLAVVALLCIAQPWRYVDSFAYPPHAAMLLLPFGAMPSGIAVATWLALNLFCLLHAGELMGLRRDLVLLACLPPAALLMAATAYPAGFLALMATLVVMQGHGRPGLGGLCLAMMTVHPQLAALFALLLLPFGYWRVVVAASAWTLALIAASVVTVGIPAWGDYLRFASAHAADSGAAP
jgi:hypothetical protein